MAKSNRATLHDLARHAGVSTATVSLVLRKSPLVAAPTRERVRASIEALGYVYNRAAASMRSRRTHTVGAAINDMVNPYFAGLTAALEQSLSHLGRMVFLANSQEDPARQARFLEAMQEYSADGAVVCPAERTDPVAFATLVRGLGLPCVLVSRDLPGSGLDYVGHDNRGAMRQGVEHLLSLGHRRIAMIGGNPWNWTGQERRQGWREALLAHGITPDPALDIPARPTRIDGSAIIDQLLALPDPPTAAACFNDMLAFGVMLGLRRRLMEPGRDFAVLGSDDVLEAALWTPALTSSIVDTEAMGTAVAQMLLDRIETPDAPPQRLILAPRLVIRASTVPG
ncbi:MAG: LacI family DNA-binding transcriptional regulator [Janthinobacterium lividum]